MKNLNLIIGNRPIIALRDKNTPIYESEELMQLHEIGMQDEVEWHTKEWAERVANNLLKSMSKLDELDKKECPDCGNELKNEPAETRVCFNDMTSKVFSAAVCESCKYPKGNY